MFNLTFWEKGNMGITKLKKIKESKEFKELEELNRIALKSD